MNHLTYTLSALALCVASPALSQTSALELWEEWQVQAATGEQTIAATATPTATGLTLTDVTADYDDGVVQTRGEIDEIVLTENADGTVSIAFSELYSMTFTFEESVGAPPGNIEIQIRHDGLEMQVSGDAGARVYTYSADSLTFSEGAIWGGGSEPPDIELDIVMTDVAATYNIIGTDPSTQRFTSEGSLGGMSLIAEVTPPAGEQGLFKIGMVLGAVTSSSSGSIMALTNFDPVNQGIPEGFEATGQATYASIGMEFLFDFEGDTAQGSYTNTGGSIGVGFTPERITYDIAANGMQTQISGSEIPVPIEISARSTELSFEIPLAASDAVQDIRLRLGINELMAGEQLLGMVDPGQAFPRDPASFILDATGQLQLFVDLLAMDPGQMQSAPGEIRALTVNEMRLSVGGAELSGTADFTFAPDQMIPMPVGRADLQLSGGNALLDALIAGGLVPQAQGEMARGMTNVFARPGASPDTLETTVEFGAGGSITANGIPLQ